MQKQDILIDSYISQSDNEDAGRQTEISQHVFKIIVIGSQGVGKSSLLQQYVKKQFDQAYNVTIGVEFVSKTVYVKPDNISVQLQIWDTAGQESFKSLIKSFYRNAAAVILCYDITKYSSYQELDMWLKEVRTHSHNDVLVVLAGNQSDQDDKREVEYEKGEEWKKLRGAHLFLETSAKNNTNVDKIFQELTQLIYNKYINDEDYRNNLQKDQQVRSTLGKTFKLRSDIVVECENEETEQSEMQRNSSQPANITNNRSSYKNRNESVLEKQKKKKNSSCC